MSTNNTSDTTSLTAELESLRRKNAELEEREKELLRELAKCEDRLQASEHLAKVGQWELEIPQNELHWSPGVFEMFEIDPTAFDASYEAFLEAIHPDDRALVNDAYLNSLKTKEPYTVYHRLQMKDGRIKYVREACHTEYSDAGEPLRSVGIVQDITELRQAKDKLKHSESRYHTLFAVANDALFIHKGDTFIDCNEATVKLYGAQNKEDIIHRKVSELSAPVQPDGRSSGDRAMELISAAMDGTPQRFEWLAARVDGALFEVEVSLNTIDVEHDTPILMAAVRDISTRKRTERELRKSEERFRQIAASIPGALYQFKMTPDGNIDFPYFSEGVIDIFGVTPEEGTKNPEKVMALVHEEDKGKVEQSTMLSAKNLTHYNVVHRVRRLDGQVKWIKACSSPTALENGSILWNGVAIDVTEQIVAEENLLKRERQLKEAQRIGRIGSFERHISSGKTFWSEEMYRLFGYEPYSVKPSHELFRSHILPEDTTGVLETLMALSPESPQAEFTFRFLRTDKEVHWATVRIRLAHRHQKGKSKVVGTFQDVTELVEQRKSMEWQLLLNKVLATCTQRILSSDYSIDQISESILLDALALTKSEHGFVASVDPHTGEILGHNLTNPLGDPCRIDSSGYINRFSPGQDGKFHLLFGHSVDTGEAFYTEDPQSHPATKGNLPEGHIPIKNFLSAPGFSEGKVRGVVALANSRSAYDQEMLEAVSRLANLFTLALARHEFQEELKRRDSMLQGFLNAVKESAFLMTPEGIVLFANETVAQRLKTTSAQLAGADIKQFIPPELADARSAHVQEVLETGKELVFEDIRFGRNVENLIYPLIEDGRVTSIAVLGLDVTERRKAEQELLKLKRAVENSPVCIVITDTTGSIEYVNPAFTTATGYSPEEVAGKNPNILNSGLHSKAFYQELWRTIRDGDTWRGEMCNRKKNGDLFWEEVAISPVKNQEGDVSHYVAIKQDISDRKDMERLKADVERIMRHDLKTPLNSIINFPQLVEMSGKLNEEQLKYVHFMESAGRRMLRMIDTSLDLFKMETGAYEYTPRDVNLVKVLQEVMESCASASSEKGIQMELLIKGRPPAEPFSVRGEEDLLYSMLSNFLINAVEASPKEKDVLIEVDDTPYTHIRISNHGAAPAEIRDHFFRKYRTYGKEKGTGLGAYSSKLIADTMGYGLMLDIFEEEDKTTITTILPKGAM